ncbi:MAG: acyl-CoA dehydrogenase family protein [Betaproteobacteria bacterium]
MKLYKFDVIVIGAGPAGVTAAGTLAGAGISVAVLEAGVYAGAENWSGCVYFAESLAEKDCFGPEAVEAAPFERRVTRRGTLIHNGLDVVGVDLTNPGIFKNCYTVLRPVYDPYYAHLARTKGAVHITETTVTSLIRKDGRVVGVQTNRGPLNADVVFIAEGDASHLVRSEQLERVQEPHYLQGVKAVLSLRPEEIEKRFRLRSGEGCAYEILIRNASIAGRTAKLNVGGFLYTNKDSLSLGYVIPLDNLKNHYRGEHDRLYEWVRGLPYLKELTEGSTLSAYGTKIIRSGGWKERPILVDDGLAVGGASAGLGVDLPFPNFTGPAAATGLFFARAVRNILQRGRTPDTKNLTTEYLTPLRESVYGKNAEYLSRWPGYFGKSKVLFGRTADITCGAAHFLSSGNLVETGRFLRSHMLSYRGLKESITDTLRAISSLGLWKSIVTSTINLSTIFSWCANLFMKNPEPDQKLGIIFHIGGKNLDAATLPWPVGSLIKRLSPGLLRALEEVYVNDNRPMQEKFANALRMVLRSMRFTDLVIVPAFGIILFLIALWTAIQDAFRFYVLKTPVETLLAEPVMAYTEAQRKTRDLDAVRPPISLEAKLATNTYRVGNSPHIRTFWPELITSQSDMSRTALWWVCPARVYVYDAPLMGRGKATVNYENCIKCESCWRAEPARTLWGRHTDHKLIYRPETGAIRTLLNALQTNPPHSLLTQGGRDHPPFEKGGHGRIELVDEKLWHLKDDVLRACRAALNASAAFRDAVAKLPASADIGRRTWPRSLGRRLGAKLQKLETALSNDSRYGPARLVQSDRTDIELRLTEGRLFHALYCSTRLEQKLNTWIENLPKGGQNIPDLEKLEKRGCNLSYEEVSNTLPDRIVKQWEEEPMPEEWAGTLRKFIAGHQDAPFAAIRALSSVSPALGLIAAHHLPAFRVLTNAGLTLDPDIMAVTADRLDIVESMDSVHIRGTLHLIPLAACRTLLLISRKRGHIVPLSAAGVTITPTPAIGFRASGLADVAMDCIVKKYAIPVPEETNVPDAPSYLSLALGAGDYLCMRVKEHAAGRIQFPGQMLDTEGRDGIAKLGAVKAMIARTEAWRLLLETLYEACPHSERSLPPHAVLGGTQRSELNLLLSAVAAMAFSPEPGAMGYDAGQVFGGFAYSEDDLMSRFYRDSALFRFLAPGYEAAAALHASLGSRSLSDAFPELGSLGTVEDEPLGKLAMRLAEMGEKGSALPGDADSTLAGQAKALAIGIRGLLTRIEKEIALGRSMEAEAAAAEVLLGLAEDAWNSAELSRGRGRVSPAALFPVEPRGAAVALEENYETFCMAPGAPHKSGGFLTNVFDRSPRFVPEIQLHDPRLRARWAELADWFRINCHDKKFGGLFIERYIEKIHTLPDDVIAAVKEQKWLATYIPKSEHGLGWRKAEYYILNSAAGNFGDAGINLLIMASTSIGTTPILLGLEDELPRVRAELAPLARHANRLGEIGTRLAIIIKSFANPNPSWIRKEYEAVMKLVDERVRHTRVVKYLAANFLRAFYGAGIAGQHGDFSGFIANLKHAEELFGKVMPDVGAALDELPRRERCHKLFLRYLGHGGVSAFALTEPTAGSDSGGVRTTAKLLSAKLTPLADGRYAFRLDEQDEKSIRYLIDADRLVFTNRGIACQTPDGQASEIKYDRYDYASDQGARYYVYQGNTCEFHDIGQVRMSNAGPVYEYYSLTGAKMWITNGSIATQFCLYAQTTEGVTGFIVDRHSEGLKVGADEKKMGQRGSPTNEISIDSVRVPREAVIGYEGHGQVNALETLNVGRCGLAVVSGALMHKLLEESRKHLPPSPERDRLLGEAAAILFGSESLAFYLIGLFDRPHESVRMESAIAKYACSEDIHELISLIEHAYGPVGQTEKFLLEKARRDARILTIYEGTNEVQRFLILKDLIAQTVAWAGLAALPDDHRARTLAEWKNTLRAAVKDAAELLGDTAWSDAILQPALFPLAEMAGEILRLECIYYRMEWLDKRKAFLAQSDPEYAPSLLEAGMRAAERTEARLASIYEKMKHGWEQVKGNSNMPEVRAADAALDALAVRPAPVVIPPGSMGARIRILAIVRPVADLSPHPGISDSSVREIIWRIDPGDLAGLSQLLDLKAASGPHVILDVLMPGGPEHDDLLRSYAGVRADDLLRLDIDPAAGPEYYVKAVRDLEVLQQYDLIVTGANCRNGEQSLGAYLAGNLGRIHYRRGHMEAKPDGTGLNHVALPAVISITATAMETGMDMTEAVSSVFSGIRVIEPPAAAPHAQFSLPAAAEAVTRTITDAAQAADYLKTYAASASSAAPPEYTGELTRGALPGNSAIWAIFDPNEQRSNLSVIRAARLAADALGEKAYAAIPAPRETWPLLLGLAQAQGCDQAFCIDTHGARLSNEGKRELIRTMTKAPKTTFLCAGPEWVSAFAYVAGGTDGPHSRTLLCSGVTGIKKQDSKTLVFSLPAYEGKLVRNRVLKDGSAFVSIAAEADFPLTAEMKSFKAGILDFAIDADGIMPLPPSTEPTLSQADVIIDVGYGVRDRSGFELALQLKRKLEALGLAPMFGATRKVTQDLKLLPLEAQIGQTGVRVNPRLVIALGISGAPQHIDYIGTRAEVLCFNKDTEAPLMKLNQTRAAPRVHPIAGDLFVTVRELIEKL